MTKRIISHSKPVWVSWVHRAPSPHCSRRGLDLKSLRDASMMILLPLGGNKNSIDSIPAATKQRDGYIAYMDTMSIVYVVGHDPRFLS